VQSYLSQGHIISLYFTPIQIRMSHNCHLYLVMECAELAQMSVLLRRTETRSNLSGQFVPKLATFCKSLQAVGSPSRLIYRNFGASFDEFV
jgi:hypothetical protein